MKIRKITIKEYVLKEEREEAKPSVFFIKNLNGAEDAQVQQLLFGGNHYKGIVESAKLGITNWKNIYDENDKIAKFSKANLLELPTEVLYEIGTEVLKISSDKYKDLLESVEVEEDPLEEAK